jgi:2-polyprenyl-6-hydroxyphenyl methylase/3-demethylubiquinone-9 3-methyltransferase
VFNEGEKMGDYYSENLSSNLLKQCYDIAPVRVQQYLESEINYVLENINKSDIVLELGCGYGRVLEKLIPHSSKVIGVDTSRESIKLALEYTDHNTNCHVMQATAEKLPFPEGSVEKVVCIQNGISAFKIEPQILMQECIRVTKTGGVCMFSSYSEKFWNHRLEWFRIQADEGLIGEIDWRNTKDGVISCKDGFRATTTTSDDFNHLVARLGINSTIAEVDESSIFCKINV